jgi:hypothetical protein
VTQIKVGVAANAAELKRQAFTMRVFRWLLLLVAVGASGAIVLALTLCSSSITNAFCPSDQLVSGTCMSRWAPAAYSTGFCIATSIGALLAIFSAYHIAPSARRFTMWSVVAVAAILPFYLVQERFPDWEFFPAVVVAVITASILSRHPAHDARLQNA